MMRNLGVNAVPLKGAGPNQRLGGGAFNRSNNRLSQSPRPPRSPATNKLTEKTAESARPSAASSREDVNRPNEDGEVPRTKESSEGETPAKDVPRPRQKDSPHGRLLADGVRQEVSVDVEPTPVDVRVPPSTVSDSIILVVPDLVTTTAEVTAVPPVRPSSIPGVSDGPVHGRPVNCILLSTDDTDPTDSVSQPTISISLDSSDDDQDDDVPPTSSSSAESISHILSSTQLSVDPRSYYIHNGPVNKGPQLSWLSDMFLWTALHI